LLIITSLIKSRKKMTDSIPDTQPPEAVLMQFIRGFTVSKALQAVAELGIADLLYDSPKSCKELAEASSTHAPTLHRLLLALAGLGIFRQDEEGRFTNTKLSEPLRSDAENSIRDHIRFIPHDGNMLAWMRLQDALRTGKSTFKNANGVPLWEYLEKHSELECLFDRAMTGITTVQVEKIIAYYDFSAFSSIVDIGGGQGLLLTEILQAYPKMLGILLERDAVAERAENFFEKKGVADRCKVISGDFFYSIPSGHDLYMMKMVLHNWSNEDALRILRRCRDVMLPQGKLIIFDMLMEDGIHPERWIDLHMLICIGGKERTKEEFDVLLSHSGFKMTKTNQLGSIGIVEAIPV
jgi:SAM-dependent methyltransferase